jgi:hypothetical protein
MATAVSTAEIWTKVAKEQSAALVNDKKALVQATADAAAAARNLSASQQALANAYATGAPAAQIAALNANTITLSNQKIVADSQLNNAAQTVRNTQASLTEANQKVAANQRAEQTSIDQPAGPVTPVPASTIGDSTDLPPDAPPVVINSQKPGEDQIAITAANATDTPTLQKPGEDQLAITAANAPLTINLQKPGEDQLATTAANAPLITEPVSISTFQDPQQAAAAAALEIPAANPQGQDPAQMAGQGLTAAKLNTASQATQQDVVNFQAKPDWRVRLSLSPGAQASQYLYWANPPGILAPLQATDGVIFPYTPDISVSYNAAYDPTELTHSNYKYFTYKGSSVDQISIGCTFTAQDTAEAQYVLAVIHFFRSVTKMFYGQDQNPKNGTPPPLCYLSGLGAFQFDAHPLVITNFTYKLPTDVDYIQAGSDFTPAGVNRQNSPIQPKSFGSDPAQAGEARRSSSGLNPGGLTAAPNWQTTNTGTKEATWVPTKINISITANPIITRNDISNKFSLKEYATGALLRGTKRAGGGIW